MASFLTLANLIIQRKYLQLNLINSLIHQEITKILKKLILNWNCVILL